MSSAPEPDRVARREAPRPDVACAAPTPPGGPIWNAMSVDVEDYFQVGAFESIISRDDWTRIEPRVERNTRRLLSLFAQRDVRATFFVLGWVAERWPALVREIRDAGHEVGTHGQDHRRVTTQTPDAFREDIRRAKRAIEDACGSEIVGYRAPNFSIVRKTFWAIDVLIEEGFRYDSSIFPIRHDHYGIPDFPRFPASVNGSAGGSLMEFPISTVRLGGVNLPFVGGGYLRLFPQFFVRWGMRRLNRKENQPAMVYLHPWEVDPDQPRQNVGFVTRVRHYRNLARTAGRLDRLMREFRFTTVREVLGI